MMTFIFTTQSKAVQGNRQFGTTYSFDIDYPKIKSDILPGVTNYGIVLFEPLNSTQNHARFIFETSVGYSNNYRFIFDIDLNVNVNKERQFSLYQNLDYNLRIDCTTNWIKTASSSTSNFSLVCRPPEANFTNIGLKTKANTAYAQYTTGTSLGGIEEQLKLAKAKITNAMNSSEQKQYLSSVLSFLRNDTKLRIINSSYTTLSNNSALQVFLISSNSTQVKRLDTVTSSGYYTIYYEADSEHFNKYLPMAQKVMNSFQITGPKLPELPQTPPSQAQPGLGPIPELPQVPGFPQLPQLPPLLP